MDFKPEDREQVWLLLADLFFLDTEPPEVFYKSTAESLKRLGVTRHGAENILIYEVASVAGANLGYLLWPVIGNWGGLRARRFVQRDWFLRQAAAFATALALSLAALDGHEAWL